jgi:UDP-3-O-[3-hydroxymyristoyl] glucosamine N-acyltransferase
MDPASPSGQVVIGRDGVIGPNAVIGFSLLGDRVTISAVRRAGRGGL